MLYMKTGSYRVVSCEGGDQCGKADAILGFLKKFEERGVSITYSSFPIYASPFGTVIRKFLKNNKNKDTSAIFNTFIVLNFVLLHRVRLRYSQCRPKLNWNNFQNNFDRICLLTSSG